MHKVEKICQREKKKRLSIRYFTKRVVRVRKFSNRAGSTRTGLDEIPSGISQPERNIFMRTCTVLALCIFQLDATGFVYDPKKLRRIKLKPRRSVIIDGLKSPWFQTRPGKEIGSLFVVDAYFALL